MSNMDRSSTKIEKFLGSDPQIMKQNPLNIDVSTKDYDVCLVFPANKETGQFFEKGAEIVDKINEVFGKSNTYKYYSVDRGEIILLLRCSVKKLKHFAVANGLKYLTNPTTLQERCKRGWPATENEPAIPPLVFANDRPDITRYSPYSHIYLRYSDRDEFQDLYYIPEGETSVFTDVQRIKIIQRILEDPEENHGLELKFGRLLKKHKHETEPTLLAVYPLHNKEKLFHLYCEWFSLRHALPWNQPIKLIREYFGEKIALYYSFLGHFALWLTFPAGVGLIFEIVIAYFQDVDYPIIPFFSLFIVIWGVVMLEFWKRAEAFKALEGGMLGFELEESYRAEFEEEEILNLTGKQVLYFSMKKRNDLITQSFCILILICFAVVGTTACVYEIRNQIAGSSKAGNESASIVASILNAIQIQIYSMIYSKLADFLTDRENHKTNTEYEDSMIAKNFIFCFVNAYSSFFYIAFFASHQKRIDYPNMPADDPAKNNQGQCGYPNCMEALAINLGIVLIVALIIGNITELLIPWVSMKLTERKELADAIEGHAASPPEKQYFKEDYDSKSILGDYLEIAILFGYMTMFVSALPASATVVFFNLWLEIKGDSWKLCTLMRRPWPRGAQDIGTWQAVFDIVIAAAVVTNAALIVFTMNLSGSDNTFTQFWIFIGFQWIVFVTQYVIRALIPDLPFEVEIQRDRADFMNRKLIMKEVEEDDSDLEALLAAGKQGDRPSQSIAQWDQKRIDALNVNGMIKEHIDD